jgi:hypothetical protein
MPISRLRQEFQGLLVDFLWSQWGQMGTLTPSGGVERRATDPEALILLTLEVGREEPRLFDEVLDWMLVNERLISLQRLRNLAVDESDRALSQAASEWLAQWRRKSPTREAETALRAQAVPLFLSEKIAVERPDPAFLMHGFLKSWNEPARRSGHPDLSLPINFAFRMRSLLGVGARAEVLRILLTAEVPGMSLQAIAASSGFAKRNVQEAAASLRAAGTVTSWSMGNEHRFDLPRERWLYLLELERAPDHRDWPQLFRALRALLRWLRAAENEGLSEYMRASGARTVVEEIAEDLSFAGLPTAPLGSGDQYWPLFEAWVRELAYGLR